jgi:hypothetical protein
MHRGTFLSVNLGYAGYVSKWTDVTRSHCRGRI